MNVCVCASISHTKPISTLPAPFLMTGISSTARSDLQFLHRNVQNGLCSTSFLLPPPPRLFFFSILFLSPLTNPPPPTSSPSHRAVDDRDVCCCFICSNVDGCAFKLEEAERNPKAWYPTSDLARRHHGGRSSGDSKARRPNWPQISGRVSPLQPLLL